MTPENLLYAKSHEWVSLQTDAAGTKLAVVGLSDFAVTALTDLVFIDLPAVGRTVAAGEIVEVNSDLAHQLEKLSDDPYGQGWLVKIKVTNEAGLAVLMDYTTYKKQCDEAND